MTVEGPKIIRALGQIRQLHEDVSLLLRTADKVMAVQGWANAKGDNRVLYEYSSSIDRPRQWMPWEVYRYYRHKDRHTTLASLTVLLDDDKEEFAEPVIAGSLVEFADAELAAGYRFWAGAFHRVMPQDIPAGQWTDVRRETLENDWDFEFQSARYFIYPLVSVTSEEILRDKIVMHLLSGLDV